MADAEARSYLSDGRCVGWSPSNARLTRLVIDAELADQDPPATLARRFGALGFWERWTRAEVAAKIADVPMAIWLREYGLGSDLGDAMRTVRTTLGGATVVVSAANARAS